MKMRLYKMIYDVLSLSHIMQLM